MKGDGGRLPDTSAAVWAGQQSALQRALRNSFASRLSRSGIEPRRAITLFGAVVVLATAFTLPSRECAAQIFETQGLGSDELDKILAQFAFGCPDQNAKARFEDLKKRDPNAKLRRCRAEKELRDLLVRSRNNGEDVQRYLEKRGAQCQLSNGQVTCRLVRKVIGHSYVWTREDGFSRQETLTIETQFAVGQAPDRVTLDRYWIPLTPRRQP